MTTKTFEEKAESEEWGAWKYVSEMLDNPDENGIYPTSKCYEQIHDFVFEQKQKAVALAVEKERERIYKFFKESSDDWSVNSDNWIKLDELLTPQ